MRLDLHTHTSRYSADSHVDPVRLIAEARGRGLDGLVLTEHDSVWPRAEVQALARASGLLVLPGVEVTTEVGHVLAYGLPHLPAGVTSARALRDLCDAHGAVMFLAHPARGGSVRLPPGAVGALFDGVEGINGSDGPMQNQASARAAGACRLPPIGGSDTHALHEIGLAATEFATPVHTLADLVAALGAGRYRAVALEPR